MIKIEKIDWKFKDSNYNIILTKLDGSIVKLCYGVPFNMNIDQAIEESLKDLYKIFWNFQFNKPFEDECVWVNIVEYRRTKKQIDVRYGFDLPRCDTNLIVNTDYYVDAENYANAIDMAFKQCEQDFSKLYADLGGVEFTGELYKAII